MVNPTRHEEFCIKNFDTAVKHWIIAAAQGHDDSISALMEVFKLGFLENEDLAFALRAHQAAVDAMKSPQRKAAEEWARSIGDDSGA